jgi:hypothetical protein
MFVIQEPLATGKGYKINSFSLFYWSSYGDEANDFILLFIVRILLCYVALSRDTAESLELDRACVTWDAHFRYTKKAGNVFHLWGVDGIILKKPKRKLYLKNAYRVLLTRGL